MTAPILKESPQLLNGKEAEGEGSEGGSSGTRVRLYIVAKKTLPYNLEV